MSGKLGPALTLINTTGGTSSGASVDFSTYTPSTMGTHNPSSWIEAVEQGNYSDSIWFQTNTPGSANGELQTDMVITPSGFVGIGTISPAYPLYVASNNTIAIYGNSAADTGIFGESGNGGVGTEGEVFRNGFGLLGTAQNDSGDAVVGESFGSGYGGFFSGNIDVTGSITAGTKDFKMDHPSDPANKYLYHASIESSEMINLYAGNFTLDANGQATVMLPEWFQAENGDFRYTLTCIGGFAPVYIAEEISENSFNVAGGKAGMKISWQVTGAGRVLMPRHIRFRLGLRSPRKSRVITSILSSMVRPN